MSAASDTHDRNCSRNARGLLSGIEAPVLAWLVRRAPTRIRPDHMTLLGLFGAGVAFAGYALSNLDVQFLNLASFGLFINWFGDSLDGTLARHRSIERHRYGFFVDHGFDVYSQLIVGLGLGLSPHVDFAVACIALLTYLSFMVVALIRLHVFGVFQITYAGLGPTEVRGGLIGLNSLLVLLHPSLTGMRWLGLTVIDYLFLAGSLIAFIGLSLTMAHDLRRLEFENPPVRGDNDNPR